MPCYSPIRGWQAKRVNSSGKRSIVFSRHEGLVDREVQVPCGKCIGCRLERSRQWAVRCVHEASLYPENCFITLTFNDDHLDKSGSLVKRDFVLFMKNLRKMFGPGIRFFHCGEYGEGLGRPHHHACIFNFDFPDKVLWSVRDGVRLYTSGCLEALWSDPETGSCKGFCTVGEVTFESAAYVARYVMKKVTGELAPSHYGGKVPEYVTMSRRPGIAAGWVKKYALSDCYNTDFLVMNGHKCKPPKFYDRCYEDMTGVEVLPSKFEAKYFGKGIDKRSKVWKGISRKRKEFGAASPDNTLARLAVREKLKQRQVDRLKRSVEHEA